MTRLLTWIARRASTERFPKGTFVDYKWYYAGFFLGELFMFAMMTFGAQLLHRSDAMTLWIGAAVAVCLLLCGTMLWARWVPAKISMALAVITWGVLVWMGLRPIHT